MGLWDDFYAQFNQKPILSTKPLPQVSAMQAETQQGIHPLTQLIASLLTPKQPVQAPGNNIAALITALRNDPVGDYNKLSSLPSSAPGSLSPFNTGFFKSAAERAQTERDRLGVNGQTGIRLAAGLPAY